MRLRSLTLHGFKSFGNRTRVELHPGVSAVVGPNGSGKSNLIDALRWATGGGRARAYRAEDKRELIFHGAAGKRSVGYAEVEVEFEPANGRPIAIRRTLTRDGTTRLTLNGRNARFLDIDEALAGTGLGTAGLSVIGQGEIGEVLMADPERLLQYVAEAAGVSRLTGRREQTQARLATAQGHLERLEDVMREIEGRLGRLRAEAEDADRHEALSREALRLRATAARERVRALGDEVADLGARAAELERATEDGKRTLQRVGAALTEAKRSLEAAEADYRRALADSEQRRGTLRVAEANLNSARERVAALQQRVDEAEREHRTLRDLTPPTPPSEEPDAAAARVEAARLRAAAAGEALAAARAERDRSAAEAQRAAERYAISERQRAAHAARLDELERQRADTAERLEALGAPVDTDTPAAAAETSAAALADAEEVLDRLRAELATAQNELAVAAGEARARDRAAERQRAAFEARRGYAQGPRNALTSGVDGIVGSVADLIRVPDDLQVALGSALGRRAEYVVVESAEVARRVLAAVRQAGGWVTLLPLDLVVGSEPSLPARLAAAAGVRGLAVDLIEVESRYLPIVRQLLGPTTVVGSMDAALAIAHGARGAWRPRLVTLEGDLLEASGAMTGGRRHSQGSVLGAAAELEEAETSAAEAGDLAQRAAARVAALQERTRSAQQVAAQAQAVSRASAAALTRAREDAAGRNRQQRDLEERLARLAATRTELQGAAQAAVATGAVPPDPADARAAALAAAAAFDQEAERHSEAAAQHSEAAQALELLQERWRSYRAAAEQHRRDVTRRDQLEQQLDTARERLGVAVTDSSAAEREYERAAAALPTDLDSKERGYQQARNTVREKEAALERSSERQAGRAQELEQLRVQRARREAALELASDEAAQFPEGVVTLELSERAAKARLREVEQELAAIGPVNHRAAQDYRSEHERFETFEVETVQAALALSELEATLERLDRETTERLDVATAGLRSRFVEHVRQLFGDRAVADIEVERDEGRPVGIRLKLQPPGKQTTSLNLLSVGERTMGALGFLFALMGDEGARLPLAVLDEVDAPLDEANIRRYTRFVADLASSGTQFLLITHQKATFEIADVLWGVTTEQGVSRVFSIARRDAEAAALPGAAAG